jgi:hypothetical protein
MTDSTCEGVGGGEFSRSDWAPLEENDEISIIEMDLK